MPKLGHEDDQDQDVNNHVDDPNDDTDPNQQDAQAEDPNVPTVVEDERIATSDEGDGEQDEGDDGRSRRRESAKERRERARQAKENDKREIDILRRTTAKQDQRLKDLEKQLTVTRVTDIDERLATAINEAERFDEVFGRAITAKNGDDARLAAKLRDEAKQRAWTLHNEREQIIQTAQVPQQKTEVPYASKAVDFLKDKQWYNPQSGDEDSLVVEALDKALMKTMDPNDPKYWTTLDKKVREKLPHRYSRNQQDDDGQDEGDDYVETPAPRRKGPPTGGTNRSSGNGNRGPAQISLPKEMVDAMKESGNWDDPVRRARVAKRYVDGLKNRNG